MFLPENVLFIAVDSVHLWEEVSSGLSCVMVWNESPLVYYLISTPVGKSADSRGQLLGLLPCFLAGELGPLPD